MNLERLGIFSQRGCPPSVLAESDATFGTSGRRCAPWRVSAPCCRPSPPPPPPLTPWPVAEDSLSGRTVVKGSALLRCDAVADASRDAYCATGALLFRDCLVLQHDHFSLATGVAPPPSTRTLHTHYCRPPGDEHYFTTDRHLRQVLAHPYASAAATELVVLSDTALHRLCVDEAASMRCVSAHATARGPAERGEGEWEEGSLLYNATCMCRVTQSPHLVLVGTSSGFVKVFDFRARSQGTAVLSLSARSAFSTTGLTPTPNAHYHSSTDTEPGSPSQRRLDAYFKCYGCVSFQGVSAVHMGAEETHTVLAAFRVPKGGVAMMDLRVSGGSRDSTTATRNGTDSGNNKRGRDGAGRPRLIKNNLMAATYYMDYGYPPSTTISAHGRRRAAAAAAALRHRMYFPFVGICHTHPYHYCPCPQQSAQPVAAIYSSSSATSAITAHPIILLSEDAEVFCTSWSALTSGSVVAAAASYHSHKHAQQQLNEKEPNSFVATGGGASAKQAASGTGSASAQSARDLPSHQTILERLRRADGDRGSGTSSGGGVALPAAARGKTYTAQGVLLPSLSSKLLPHSDLFVSTDLTHRSLHVRTQGRRGELAGGAREMCIPLPFDYAQRGQQWKGDDLHVASLSGLDGIVAVHSSHNETCYVRLD